MGGIASNIERFAATRGFAGFLIASLLGALGVLGHAPFHFWPAFAASICGLLVLLDSSTSSPKPLRAGFGVAWSWAFGYFLAGMFWVGNAFLVDAEKFALLMPFAMTALPAVLAVFWGIAGALYARFWHPDASRLLLFGVLIGVVEFGRGHMFTGLPWNLPAYVWKPGGVISQMSAVIGPFGLTLLSVIVLASPALFLTKSQAGDGRKLALGGAALVLVAMLAFGLVRLGQAGKPDAMAGKGPMISAGQGGFTQREVWDSNNSLRVTQTYLDLLNHAEAQKSDMVIWPEGAFPFLLGEQGEVLETIQQRLGARTLIVGSIRRDQGPSGDVYYNSIYVMDNDRTKPSNPLTLRATYDKFHLVPFGEYLPLRPLFKALGIASLVAYDGEMTPGAGPATLAIKGAPIADPRVCYEIVFPHFNPKAIGKAGWILNVSIDAWYGDLLGPDQHYAKARARAIETGMPMVRAASGGWSAIVDRYGRPLAEHPKGAGYAVARLPLDARTTIYGRGGDTIFLALCGFLFVILLVWRHKGVDFGKRLEDEGRKKQDHKNVK